MAREAFVTGEIYHLYNRGVEKRTIFLKSEDYVRFVHDLWEFNDASPATNTERRFQRGLVIHEVPNRVFKTIVEILAWCLMPNHYHLMLRQKVDDG